MISKDARDKAREKAGLDFVKDMSKKGWNVNDITKRWYNTEKERDDCGDTCTE